MGKKMTFTLPLLSQEHVSGLSMSRFLGDLLRAWPNETTSGLASKFQRKAQQYLVDDGEIIDLLRYCRTEGFEVEKLAVTIPASDKRLDSQDHQIELDLIYSELRVGQWFGFVPALQIANYAGGFQQLQKNLIDSTLLEFHRSKRLDDQKSLIACQWYSPAKVTSQAVELYFPTPAELAASRHGQKEKIVPKTASLLTFPKSSIIGFETYLGELERNLNSEFRQSVLVVGPNGCGKTALILDYFRQSHTALGQQSLPYEIWQTSAAQLLRVLTENQGWQHELGRWIAELRDSTDIVYVGNYSELFEVGQYSGSNVSIADALREPIQRSEITLVGELTEEQLATIELRSPGYSDAFQVIRFEERAVIEENSITERAVVRLCQQYKVGVSADAVRRIISLHRRYSPYSGYPGKTIRFFESLLLSHSPESSDLSEDDVIQAFCDETGMPRFLVDNQVPFSREKATDYFCGRIISQRVAIEELINGLVSVKTGMTRTGKPILSTLFVGPTGVGKTELAKTLASYLFGDESRMIRFDMSEYADPSSVSRLIAAGEASLVTKVRQQPFAVVLLDEIEKADASFLDLLLQLLDEGRLTDNRGEIANFCSTIVIMTSNIGADGFAANPMGFMEDGTANTALRHFEDAVTSYFRPELFNRLDMLVPFAPLDRQELLTVARAEVSRLKRHPAIVGRPLTLTINEEVYTFLASRIESSKYGARAVQRIILEEVLWPLSTVLASYAHTDSLEITVSVVSDKLKIMAMIAASNIKTVNSLNELADKAAGNRRERQALENGGTWISVLSQLDQLEAKKAKSGEKFWRNVEAAQAFNTYRRLVERFQHCMSTSLELETRVLGLMRSRSANVSISGFSSELINAQSEFDSLLVQLDSVINENHNEVSLNFYGQSGELPQLERIIEGWIESLGLDFSVNYHYLKSPTDSADSSTIGDQSASSNELSVASTRKATDPDYEFVSSNQILAKTSRTLVGKGLVIKGEAVSHYFARESGVWELEHEQGKSIYYVELSTNKLEEYLVPSGVHRRIFYKDKKRQRKIFDGQYQDKRVLLDKPHLLSAHPEIMTSHRLELLKQLHLNPAITQLSDLEAGSQE